jgi:hypothetical protein
MAAGNRDHLLGPSPGDEDELIRERHPSAAHGAATWQLGRCPRCGGTTQEEEDHLGRFRSCLVCGWLEEVTHPLGEWELISLPEEVWQRLAQLLGSEALGVKSSQQGKQWEG